MMGWHRLGSMHPHNMAIEVWCEETWGERPVRVSDWANHDDIVQVLIRLSSSVLIADFLLDSDGSLLIQQHLHVPLETWNPGSYRAFERMMGRHGSNTAGKASTCQANYVSQNGGLLSLRNGS